MIWLEHFDKLLIVYRSSYQVKNLIFHTAKENGRDSSSDSKFSSVIASLVAAYKCLCSVQSSVLYLFTNSS